METNMAANPRAVLKSAALSLALAAGAASAQEVITLKLAHFLPASATQQLKFMEPWCAKVNKESNGKLKCQIYPSNQLGGTPAQLFDQAKDGVADLVWTLPGYQAGRFIVSEVFELPFMVSSTEKGSRVLWHYLTKNATEEFKGVKPIAFNLHDGSLLHTTKKQVKVLEDFKGLKVRTPTRQATKMIVALGGTPVTMPVGLVPEAMSKGVIDGAMVPWEVAPSAKLDEVAKFHTEIDPSMPQISNSVFIFGINQAKYDSLPPELKKVIDANSGPDVSAEQGRILTAAGAAARKTAKDRGNTMYVVPAAEAQRWQKAAQSVTDDWVKDVTAKGYDGKKLLEEARAALK
jgi:TRAP-type C4-dicarboxylate transport system substrate-binding protein